MKNRFFSRIFGAFMALGLFIGSIPAVAAAATVRAPYNLSISSGYSANDTTPTFRWSQPSGATWYSYHVNLDAWTNLGNVSSVTLPALADGWHTFYVRAHDSAGNASSVISYTFEVDTEGPTVPAVTPSSADVDEEVTFAVDPYGESATVFCDLYVDGDNVGTMRAESGEFYKAYTFDWEGTYTVYARCADGDGNYTMGTSRRVTVGEGEVYYDYYDLSVPVISPSTAEAGEEVIFTVEPTSDSEVLWCDLYIDGRNMGDMQRERGDEFTFAHTFDDAGSYAVYASCADTRRDIARGVSRTVRVTENGSSSNNDILSVPRVTPSSAEEDERTTFTVRPSGRYDVVSCSLYVDALRVATMRETSSNVFTASYTFARSGDYRVHAVCEDARGNRDVGSSRVVSVDSTSADPAFDFDAGTLIKIRCGSSSAANDTCRAVYYYGEDGKRHAFPNEGTFLSWYTNFDDVVEISASTMSEIPLGKNVTYRPGSVLMKFASSSKVYALEKEHTLRHYMSMDLVRSDYGADADRVIVVLPDYLFGNYTVGSVIDSTRDFDRTEAYYSVDTIEDVL